MTRAAIIVQIKENVNSRVICMARNAPVNTPEARNRKIVLLARKREYRARFSRGINRAAREKRISR